MSSGLGSVVVSAKNSEKASETCLKTIKNQDISILISIDLEWFFHDDVNLFNKMNLYQRKNYNGEVIQKAVNAILEVCSKNNSTITFFVLGELFDAYPDLLYSIKKRGHEIAYHTHGHKIINNKSDLEQEFKMSKNFIDEFSPKGFRAPNIHLSQDCLKLLKDYGFEYDSSTYGTKKFKLNKITILPVSIYPYSKKTYTEYPNPLTFNLLLESIPFGSGLFSGLLKNNISYFIKKYSDTYKEPSVIFLHSWQIIQPLTPWQFKLKKPLMIPYSVELKETFSYILSRFNSLKMCDYIIKEDVNYEIKSI